MIFNDIIENVINKKSEKLAILHDDIVFNIITNHYFLIENDIYNKKDKTPELKRMYNDILKFQQNQMDRKLEMVGLEKDFLKRYEKRPLDKYVEQIEF